MYPLQNALKTLEPPGAKMPALHAVHQQQQLLLIAQLPQTQQIFRLRRHDPDFPLHAFHQNGRGGGRQRGPRRRQIVERDVPETGNHRPESFLHLGLPGRGDARERPSVKGILRGQNFKPAFVVAEAPRQFVKAFVRLGAAVAKENLSRPDQPRQFLRQPPLRLVII